MTIARRARIDAPAKVNLGLEILGRRADGYHEIRSILAMVELADQLEITPGEHREVRILGMPDIPAGDNLIVRAGKAFRDATGVDAGWDIAVTKRIPSPAGLGGASSDAAATLLALNAMHGSPLPCEKLADLAAGLGSDVPFFLGSPVALVSGRGTTLEPLPPISGPLVIVTPALSMAAKTATLYRMLTQADMTNGSQLEALARGISAGAPLDPALLANAFARPLRELAPEAQAVADHMRDAGCLVVALSGAGPAHYALFADDDQATAAASVLQDTLGPDVSVLVTRFRQQPLRFVLDDVAIDRETSHADRSKPDASRART